MIETGFPSTILALIQIRCLLEKLKKVYAVFLKAKLMISVNIGKIICCFKNKSPNKTSLRPDVSIKKKNQNQVEKLPQNKVMLFFPLSG